MKTVLKKMKSLSLIGFVLFTLLTPFLVNAQSDSRSYSSAPIYSSGTDVMREFIIENLNYPEEAKRNSISGNLIIGCMINKEGKIENCKVLGGINPEFDKESLRIVQLIDEREPGLQQSKHVNSYISIPIDFNSDVNSSMIIRGKVVDKSTRSPIENVLVKVEGTNVGTFTKIDGSYCIIVPEKYTALEYSSTGYATKTELISKNQSINIEIEKEDLSDYLKEVIAVHIKTN